MQKYVYLVCIFTEIIARQILKNGKWYKLIDNQIPINIKKKL
jgi:hypothetical protein